MMKKVIVSLLVLALAMTSVFAAVNFSGELVTGYTFNYDKDSEEWTNWMYGQDNLDTNSTQLKLGIAAAQNSSNTVASGFAYWYRHFYATAQTNSSFGVAILSYSAQNETLRAPIREWYEKVFDMAKTAGDDVQDVLLAILAIEGLFYLHHLNLNTLTPQENEQVINRVIKRFEKKTEVA